MRTSMKKVLCIILSMFIVIALSGCARTGTTTAKFVVTDVNKFNLSTKEGFINAVGTYEELADKIYKEIQEEKEVTTENLEVLIELQKNLDQVYETVKQNQYYDDEYVKIVYEHFQDGYYRIITLIDNSYESGHGEITYSNGKFAIGENFGERVIFLQNMAGKISTGWDEENIYVKRVYNVLDSQNNAFIIVEGVETSPSLYVILNKETADKYMSDDKEFGKEGLIDNEVTIFTIFIIGTIVFGFGAMYLFFISRRENSTIFKRICLIGASLSTICAVYCIICILII